MDSEKLSELRQLFRQLDEVEQKIEALLGGGTVDRQPGVERGKQSKAGCSKQKKYERSDGLRTDKIRHYECKDCGHEFDTNLPKIDARCIKCSSLNVDYKVVPTTKSTRILKIEHISWTPELENQIISMVGAGKKFAEISEALGINKNAAYQRYWKLKKTR